MINENSNTYLNDMALDDPLAIPGLLLGGVSTFRGLNAFNRVRPFLGDIWAGRGLIFHKPFNKMTRQEFNDYGELGRKYYQNHLQKNPVNKEGYGLIEFGRKNRGKDKTQDFENYPFLRKNLYESSVVNSSNRKNEADRYYDYLVNPNNSDNYNYLIEVIKDRGLKYKMMKKNE